MVWGHHSLMLGCPETLRRMSTSFSVACRSSCTSLELKLPPPVMSMTFTAYSWHVGLWMQRLTTLLTPLRVQRTEGPGAPPQGKPQVQATAEKSSLVPQLPVNFWAQSDEEGTEEVIFLGLMSNRPGLRPLHFQFSALSHLKRTWTLKVISFL